jgi:hypothetical protein
MYATDSPSAKSKDFEDGVKAPDGSSIVTGTEAAPFCIASPQRNLEFVAVRREHINLNYTEDGKDALTVCRVVNRPVNALARGEKCTCRNGQ